MPLPIALQDRLIKRGLLPPPKFKPYKRIISTHHITTKKEEEEPSQYDREPAKNVLQERFWIQQMKRRMQTNEDFSGYECCPNKSNIFHCCSLYCLNKWGDGIVNPDPKYLKLKEKLLKKFPLLDNWEEVYDRGTGVHYYWNRKDDTVSWLPPTCPGVHISKSARELRKELFQIENKYFYQFDDFGN